jgi:hypothetical protein
MREGLDATLLGVDALRVRSGGLHVEYFVVSLPPDNVIIIM